MLSRMLLAVAVMAATCHADVQRSRTVTRSRSVQAAPVQAVIAQPVQHVQQLQVVQQPQFVVAQPQHQQFVIQPQVQFQLQSHSSRQAVVLPQSSHCGGLSRSQLFLLR